MKLVMSVLSLETESYPYLTVKGFNTMAVKSMCGLETSCGEKF
jgi:hypothetical protein